MISPKVKAGCGVVTVFGLGFVLGFFCLLIIIGRVIPLSEGWKSERSKEFVADHFADQLNLTEEQRASFRPLVDEALEKRWKLRRDYLLEDRRLMEEDIFPKAAELLTPEQKEKAGQMLDSWRQRQRSKVEGSSDSGPEAPAEINASPEANLKEGSEEKTEAKPDSLPSSSSSQEKED